MTFTGKDIEYIQWLEEKLNNVAEPNRYAVLGEVRELCDSCDAVYDLLRKLYTKNGKGGKLLDNMINKSNKIKKHFS